MLRTAQIPDSATSQLPLGGRARSFLRAALFAYLAVIMCPVQYFALTGDVDNTWIFALNYAAAHHLVMGSDFVWTSGPLSYLAVPMDIGNNLAQGFAFQLLVWVVVLAIIWDVIFRSSLPIRNLLFFSIFLGLSGNLYHSYPNPLGAGDLLLASALILLVQFESRGGKGRYLTALVMMGVVPLIQIVGAISIAGVVIALALCEIWYNGLTAWRRALLAITVPLMVSMVGLWVALGSMDTLLAYLRASRELSNGYNLAMSLRGAPVELLAASETLILAGILLVLLRFQDSKKGNFLVLVLAVPAFLNFKHAFVRQDVHIAYIFCFTGLVLALVSLGIVLQERRQIIALAVVMLLFTALWQDNVARTGLPAALGPTGVRTLALLWKMSQGNLRQKLRAEAERNIPAELRVEPEIRAIINQEPVASLSDRYSGMFADGLNLVLYPVLQRYSAYTPYLDELNAAWVRTKGPHFLIYDPDSDVLGPFSDFRHPWTETPAMWVEIFRWYDLRYVGTHTLLLQRRAGPRFTHFESIGQQSLRAHDGLRFPPSPLPVFWTMRCSLTTAGKLRALLFRVPPVTVTILDGDGRSRVFRIVPAVLGAPSMGNYLPSDLAEFVAVFNGRTDHSFFAEKLTLGGPGASAYAPNCDVELLRPSF